MNRRDFLRSSAWAGGAFGLAVLTHNGCGGGGDGSPTGPGDSSSRSFVSSTDDGHTHSVTLNRSEVDSPPSGGVSRQTSSSSGHTHTFTMTQAQLQSVQGGGTVSTTTSSDSGHTHTFSISKWY